MISQIGPTQRPHQGSMEHRLQEIKTNPIKSMITAESQSVLSDTQQLTKTQSKMTEYQLLHSENLCNRQSLDASQETSRWIKVQVAAYWESQVEEKKEILSWKL